MSSRLKNMKFMKRKSNSEKRKTKQHDQKSKIEAMQWIQSDALVSNLIVDDRRDEYMMYRTGRKSFGNFNEAVEKMQKESDDIISQQTQTEPADTKTSKQKNKLSKNKNENKNTKKRSLPESLQTNEAKDSIKEPATKRPKT